MLLDASKHLIHPLLMHFHCLFHQRCQRCCKWHLDVTLAGAGAGATKQNRTPQPKQTAKNPTKTLPPPPPPPNHHKSLTRKGCWIALWKLELVLNVANHWTLTVQVALEVEIRTPSSVPLKCPKNVALMRKTSGFKTPVKKSSYQSK